MTYTPEEQEAADAKVVYNNARMLANYNYGPDNVIAATIGILQAAFIMATADLSAERRAGMFLESK